MGRRDHPGAQHQEAAHRDPPEKRPARRSGENRCAAATGLSPELETTIRLRFDESAHRCPDPEEEEIHAAARVTARRAPPTPPTRRAAPHAVLVAMPGRSAHSDRDFYARPEPNSTGESESRFTSSLKMSGRP